MTPHIKIDYNLKEKLGFKKKTYLYTQVHQEKKQFITNYVHTMVHKSDFELTKSVLQGFIWGPALTVKNLSKVRTLRQLPCAIAGSLLIIKWTW